MGMFDEITIDTSISIPDIDRDGRTWQMKSMDFPSLDEYKVDEDGQLYHREYETKHVPEEERKYYETDKWDDPLFRMAGMLKRIDKGWEESDYSGGIRFNGTVDDELRYFVALFENGELVHDIIVAD